MSDVPNDTVTVPEIGPIDADQLVRDGAFLLDVRENDEWDAGHAPDAHHVVLGELVTHLAELPVDTPIVVVCRSGGRSALAAARLIVEGFQSSNLQGGMQAWQAVGFPVVDAHGHPGAVI